MHGRAVLPVSCDAALPGGTARTNNDGGLGAAGMRVQENHKRDDKRDKTPRVPRAGAGGHRAWRDATGRQGSRKPALTPITTLHCHLFAFQSLRAILLLPALSMFFWT